MFSWLEKLHVYFMVPTAAVAAREAEKQRLETEEEGALRTKKAVCCGQRTTKKRGVGVNGREECWLPVSKNSCP